MKNIFSMFGLLCNRGLSQFGLQIKRTNSGVWDFDPAFLRAYGAIRDRTLVKIDRSYMLYQFAQSMASSSEGDVAQVGVYKGGTAKMIAGCFAHTNKKMYLFDTFAGLPPASEEDGVKNARSTGKEFADLNFSDIERYFSEFSNVEFKKGFFPNTARGLEDRKFCFVYLDADLYKSTKDGLDFFYPRMVPGGVILLDDYGTNTWPGVERAVREFCVEKAIFPIKTVWWQGLIVKVM